MGGRAWSAAAVLALVLRPEPAEVCGERASRAGLQTSAWGGSGLPTSLTFGRLPVSHVRLAYATNYFLPFPGLSPSLS